MEILIHVPPWLNPYMELLTRGWENWLTIWTTTLETIVMMRATTHQLLQMPYSNVIVPIIAVLLVFWPILLSLAMAIISAWAWIFWLITSMILGIVQVGYATYQFFMISLDICGLSILKTYTIVRNQFIHIIDKKGSRRKSRRKLWRSRLEQAGCYENFLKIRIEAKDTGPLSPKMIKNHRNETTKNAIDGALPPHTLGRSYSFSGVSSPTSDPNDSRGSSPLIPRNRSFSGQVDASSSSERILLDHDPVVLQELGRHTADLLVSTTLRLDKARVTCLEHPDNAEAASALQYLLAGVVKRNHLQLDDIVIQNARSVAESGQYGLSQCTRQLIRRYYEQVEKCLDWVVEAPFPQDRLSSSSISQQHHEGDNNDLEDGDDTFPMGGAGSAAAMDRHSELGDRITFMRKMKQNMGRTALMLSGGGAQAMYHLGVVRALVESKLYDDMKVISGTSGGSITAAMCAIKTPEELVSDVCVNTVSTDYMLNGEMKKHNIRWFPPMIDMASYWIKHKLLVDTAYFGRTCEHYFKDITFEEAFLRTGKHVCITVSASRASGETAQRLLLNHISTPHVTIASAVRASCALPGVMAPAKLTVKNSNGTLEPFEVDGVEWIDGSVQADLPFQRIATLFAVTSFVVSQTNFHVVPFLNKEHHPNQKSLYWRLFQTIEWDIRSRALKLSRLGLFPRMFGQDVSKIFKQKYHGNLTIVPRFTTMQTFGLKALSNPSVKDMDGYLKYSQIATWPYLNAIRDMIRLEKALDDCLARLESRIRMLNPDIDWSSHDDIDSIESGSVVATVPSSTSHRVRIVGRPHIGVSKDREAEKLRRKVNGLEQENQHLRDELERLSSRLNNNVEVLTSSEKQLAVKDDERDSQNTVATSRTSLSDGSEGAVWNLVRRTSS